jgi:hypothetical protein
MGAGISGLTAGATVSDITVAYVFPGVISLDATLRLLGTTEPDCSVLLCCCCLAQLLQCCALQKQRFGLLASLFFSRQSWWRCPLPYQRYFGAACNESRCGQNAGSCRTALDQFRLCMFRFCYDVGCGSYSKDILLLQATWQSLKEEVQGNFDPLIRSVCLLFVWGLWHSGSCSRPYCR